MKGILRYFTHDPEFINSREGWSVTSIDSNNFYSHHLVDETDREVRDRFEKGLIKSGDEVEYELLTDCYVDKERNLSIHRTVAKIIFEKENKQKLFFISNIVTNGSVNIN